MNNVPEDSTRPKNQRLDQVKTRPLVRQLILAGFSLFLCSFTLVLGAVPLHIWRQAYGKGHFLVGVGIMVSAMMAFGLYPLSVVLATLSLLIFLFSEFEDRGLDFIRAGVYALLGTSLSCFVGVKAWVVSTGVVLSELITKPVNTFLQQLKSVNGANSIQVPVEEIVAQVPSGVVIVLAASLVMALLFEPRLRQMMQLPLIDRNTQFLQFRLPDAFVWLTIGSLLAAFLKTDFDSLKTVGINLVNILVFAYFLQGMAIVTGFFNTYKVGPLMRSIAYVFLVLQLFVFVSCIGFIDFWFDFRSRLNKKPENIEKVNGKGGLS